jgi:hypothetical protein
LKLLVFCGIKPPLNDESCVNVRSHETISFQSLETGTSDSLKYYKEINRTLRYVSVDTATQKEASNHVV